LAEDERVKLEQLIDENLYWLERTPIKRQVTDSQAEFKRLPVIRVLPTELQAKLFAQSRRALLEHGAILFSKGMLPNAVFLVVRGLISTTYQLPMNCKLTGTDSKPTAPPLATIHENVAPNGKRAESKELKSALSGPRAHSERADAKSDNVFSEKVGAGNLIGDQSFLTNQPTVNETRALTLVEGFFLPLNLFEELLLICNAEAIVWKMVKS